MSSIRSHDALFRFVFGDIAAAADLLRVCVPAPLAAAIDWTRLRLLSGTFVDEVLAEREADLLFVAPAGDLEVLLHMLVEHKAKDERFVALQTVRYSVRILDRWLAANPAATCLPLVLPIVVHHGARPMRAPRSLRGLVNLHGLPPRLAGWLRGFLPPRGFVLFDLAALSAQDLRALSLSAVTEVTLRFLLMLRHLPPAAAIEALGQWRELLLRLLNQARGQEVFTALFSWLLAGMPHAGLEVRRVVDEIDDQRIKGTMKSILDALLDEGREAGREEGRLQGRRGALADLLRERFGELQSSVHDRIQVADEAMLIFWQRRALWSVSLDEVFAEA